MSWQSTVSVGGAIYSVACALVDARVWVRADGEELVIVHADGSSGPREVARHHLTTPGRPRICDEHYPPKPPGALERVPTAQTDAERAFLEIGPGAADWLTRAAAAGTVACGARWPKPSISASSTAVPTRVSIGESTAELSLGEPAVEDRGEVVPTPTMERHDVADVFGDNPLANMVLASRSTS